MNEFFRKFASVTSNVVGSSWAFILAALPIPYSGAFGWARHIWFSDRFHFLWLKGDCTAQNKIKLLCWI